METALFFYNILIIIAFAVCSIEYFLLYYKHRDKSQLWIAIVFLLFIFDNLQLYMFEFLPGFTQVYFLHVSSFKYLASILTFLIIFSYRLTIIAFQKKPLRSSEAIFWFVIFLLTIFTTAVSSSSEFNLLDNILLSITVIGVFADGLYSYRRDGGFPKRPFVPEIGPFFLVASLFFEVCDFCEAMLGTSGFYILNQQRPLSIELLSIFYSAAAIYFLFKRQIVIEKFEGTSLEEIDKDLLKKFGDAYGLTARENEILGYLLQGISNAEICKATFISEGTVKTHSHNIYIKLDIKNRAQLGKKLREFQKIK